MAHLYRRLSLHETYQLQAPYTPAETGASFHLPDQHFDFFDLVATTLVGPYYFRAIPSNFETSPEWEPDVLCNASGARCLVNSHSKLVEIPANHRAWIQYNGFVTHMIENGADVDIYGRGLVHINIYGIKEENWSHPQIILDHQHSLHHGYASDKLIELVVEGLGRKRAEALARLVTIAKSKGGLGGVGMSRTENTMHPSSTILAIGARLEQPGVAFTIIDSTTTPQAFEAQPATFQEDASTNSTPLQVSASSSSMGKSAVTRESTTSSTPNRNSFNTRLFVAATTDLVRQASPASDETKKTGNDRTKQSSPAKESPVVVTKSPRLAENLASTSPPATPSPLPSKTPSRASPPASSKVGAKLPQTPPTSGNSSAKATPMSRSPAMGVPTQQGERTKPLSGAQRRKLKKLAANAGASSTTAPAQLSVVSSACRVVAGPLQSTSGLGLARISHESGPTLLEANTIQDLVSTRPPAQFGAVATANSVT
ncbi:hypothetical protein P7C70_g9160, partial [Phenoliferia sp. Uapishka_3]